MFRISIRDLLWLTLAVALCVAWQLEKRLHYALLAKHQLLESQMIVEEMTREGVANL